MSAKLVNSVNSPSLLSSSEASPHSIDPGITTAEAARTLGFSAAALKRWRAEGRGPSYIRIGRSIRYRSRDLKIWQERHVVKTPDAGEVTHD